MDETRYARAKEIFLDACDRPLAERRAFVADQCGSDEELLAMVLAMLDVDSSESAFMAEPLESAGLVEAADAPPAISGYEVLERIGKGGMGEVWLAEQLEPVHRRVALKIIKRGMDTERIVARFEAERQALALMDHHNVARVFDAGATADGRPFFAMEHVRGLSITAFCDRQRLTTRERLELFQQVCTGVQHAHYRGIIHRDLKPSNVLIQIEDGQPLPKIIDFGIAKATQQRLGEQTIFTEPGQLIGTPEYMSPEQAELTAQDVDTRTDVYSLGVLLYEVLVGALPFDSRELRLAGYDEIRRRIREQEPSRPSQRVSTLGERSADTAQRRRVDASTLRRQLRGDLDWIAMKALEKDRTRRYASPSELASDLGRHLSHEPVLARPPRVAYQARKFVRRHRVGVGVAGTLLVIVLVFAITTAAQYRRIAVEARTSEQMVLFLTGLFEVSYPSEARGNTITVREILDEGAKAIEGELAEQPIVQARLMDTMGHVYLTLGLHAQAQPLLERSAERFGQLFGDANTGTLNARRHLASLYCAQGRYERAEGLLLENLVLRRREVGPDHPDTLGDAHVLATTYLNQGRYAEAETLYLATIDVRKRVQGADHLHTRESINNLAGVYQKQGRDDEAEQLYLENLEVLERTAGRDHPSTLRSMSNLAGVYLRQRRYAEAESLFLETIEIKKHVLGEEHENTLGSIIDLATVYFEQGRLDEAEPLYLDSLDPLERVLGEDHPHTLTARTNLAFLYSTRGRNEEALSLSLQVLVAKRRVLGSEHPSTLWSLTFTASLYGNLGRLDDAVPLLREAAQTKGRVLGAQHPETHEALINLAVFAAGLGDHEAALEALDLAVEGGFSDPDRLTQAAFLSSLPDTPFEALVERARQNAATRPEMP